MAFAPLILASASPRRRELLQELGVPFEVRPAAAPEWHHPHCTARELSLANAHRKARTAAGRFRRRIILGADTLVARGATIYGKPRDRSEAERMLTELAGHTHTVVTGVCLIDTATGREWTFAETTAVTFHRLSRAQIRAYLRRINPLDKAGAYSIQEHGERIVKRIDGSFSNVVGLPLERLRLELARFAPQLVQVTSSST